MFLFLATPTLKCFFCTIFQHVNMVLMIPVHTDVTFKLLSAGWHLMMLMMGARVVMSLAVCSLCPDLLLLRRSAKSTANVFVSPSAAVRCHLRAPTVQPRRPHPDPQPATHPLHRYMNNTSNQTSRLYMYVYADSFYWLYIQAFWFYILWTYQN